MRPVRIEPLTDEGEVPSQVYLLFEVAQPPMISQRTYISPFVDHREYTKRLPGNLMIAHANVWLFQLNPDDDYSNYKELFVLLNRHNLTPRAYRSEIIPDLVRVSDGAQSHLDSIKLLSNSQWIERNRSQVDEFRTRRWSTYSFDTKFEIMKLISKHIITVHDLVVDEHADGILRQCSIDTLNACTGKCT